jgi:Histidine kinase-, DNA gyrase B-, and HSP90-like ATPase
VPRLAVDVREDHLRRLVSSDAVSGVAELIWNALDAEAENVNVRIVENPLGGVNEVIVEDDGHGMTFDAAKSGFSTLGGSWKLSSTHTLGRKRVLHGREGKGRWRAFAIGDEIGWVSVAEEPDGRRTRIHVRGSATDLGVFDLSEPEATKDPLGTTVTVEVGTKRPTRLLADDVVDILTARLVLYLEQYRSLSVSYRGTRLDPTKLQTRREEYDVAVDAEYGPVTLVVIEWARPIDRRLYLCDENGTTLQQVEPRIHAPGFDFTAYIRWAGFRVHEGELLVAELSETVRPVVEAARNKLREHFKQRQAEETRAVVEAWKTEQVYPYEEDPKNEVEKVERELFEVVALSAASAVNSTAEPASKKLSLRLLRQALSDDPGALRRILAEVLDLPKQRLEELNELLEKTTLTAIITAARIVTDRLDFLRGLELLVFDPVSKEQLLERTQLHRILANETWIFGEEFALTADDQALTTVLEKHRKLLGRDDLAEDHPVLDDEGKVRVVDLMLARSLEQARNRREHLVIELKRPNVKIGDDALTQIKRYAYTVADDERFSKTEVEWDFVVVSNELDAFAGREALQRDRPPGLVAEPGNGRVRVWVKTWGQVIEESRHRLKFVQQSLQYLPNRDDAVQVLRRVHAKYLPQVFAVS